MNTNGLFCTTSVSGTQWSREWKNSSGTRIWLEQGGHVDSKTTVTFSKSFSNTNYTLVGCYAGTTDFNWTYGLCLKNKTNTSFVVGTSSGGANVDWYACGK